MEIELRVGSTKNPLQLDRTRTSTSNKAEINDEQALAERQLCKKYPFAPEKESMISENTDRMPGSDAEM